MKIYSRFWITILVLAAVLNLAICDIVWALPSYSIRVLNPGEYIMPEPGTNSLNDQIGHDPMDGDFIISGTDGSSSFLYELSVPFGALPPRASDINDMREIVGTASFTDHLSYGFYYSEGSVINLGTLNDYWSPNDTQSTAVAINNKSDIVGYSVASPDSEYYQPYLYTEDEMYALQHILSEDSSWMFLSHYAEDLRIDDFGFITGTGFFNGVLENFVMTPNTAVPVPEPGTIVLLSTGLVGILVATKRKFQELV
jgi:probable HAF family extracellular repeat protein